MTPHSQTEEGKLEKWCAERKLFSKADLMRYGLDNYYLRAWRTGCEFVSKGLARKLTKQECINRNLPTSMGWYEWVGEPTPLYTDTQGQYSFV